MKKTKDPAISETLRLLAGMTVCLGLMLGVYWLIDRLDRWVILGGVIGTLVAVGNFFFMAMGLSNLTSDAAEARVRLRTQSSFTFRMLGIAAILVGAVKLLGCDAVATLLPLLFTRPILMIEQFILRTKEDKNANSN